MKKQYNPAEIEIIRLEACDILTESIELGGESDEGWM